MTICEVCGFSNFYKDHPKHSFDANGVLLDNQWTAGVNYFRSLHDSSKLVCPCGCGLCFAEEQEEELLRHLVTLHSAADLAKVGLVRDYIAAEELQAISFEAIVA